MRISKYKKLNKRRTKKASNWFSFNNGTRWTINVSRSRPGVLQDVYFSGPIVTAIGGLGPGQSWRVN